MEARRRVLVVDNDEDMRDMLAFRLDLAGYMVFTAASAAEALDLVEREVIHMAVLDVRLDDDGRPGDQSGFDLGQRLPASIPYIAFTAYEDEVGNLRRANRLGAIIHNKATDDAIPQLLDLIEETFRTRVQVNVDLAIDLRCGGLSCADLAAQIEAPGPDGAPPPSGDDLERIVQTLFADAAAVELEPLLPPEQAQARSRSGALLIRARPRYASGPAEPVVVKLGAAAEIRREAESFPLIEPFLRGNRRANLRHEAYSRRLGGLVYDLVDDEDLGAIRTFEDVYRAYDAAKVVALLERFFGQMLAPLFRNAQRRELDLTEVYAQALRLTPAKLEAALRRLHPDDADAPLVRLPGLHEPQLNPLVWLREGDGLRRFTATVAVCLCHGDLHGRNILVDSADRFWLIDFARAGQCHALRDFAELETDIKFHLLGGATLAELLPFERQLLAPALPGEAPPPLAPARPELRKAYEVVAALRRIAAEQLHLDGDMREYYLALLFHTLNIVRMGHVGDAQKEHALLAAALICRRLDAWPAWGQPATDSRPQGGGGAAGPAGRATVAGALRDLVGRLLGG